MADPPAPGTALRFDVRIDGVPVGVFSGCSGLGATYEAFEWREGGDNGTVVRLPGRLSYSTVRLVRPVDHDSGRIAAWFAQQRVRPQRCTAVITLYDANSRQVASWKLDGAWPVSYSGPRLASGPEGQAVAVETLELCHQGFVP